MLLVSGTRWALATSERPCYPSGQARVGRDNLRRQLEGRPGNHIELRDLAESWVTWPNLSYITPLNATLDIGLRQSSMDITKRCCSEFPINRLARKLRDSTKQPIVLVACGSFNPVTYLHLRMFEIAADFVRQNTDFEVVGGYLSPVSDMYKKPELLNATHRWVIVTYRLKEYKLNTNYIMAICEISVAMCNIAASQASNWLMVDSWEALQSYQRTAVVLDHFNHELNTAIGGIVAEVCDHEGRRDTQKRRINIMLLTGSDMMNTMSEPGVWSDIDVCFVIFEILLSIHCAWKCLW